MTNRISIGLQMAFLLYKRGTAHTIRGVKCDFIRVEKRDIIKALADGWVKDLQSLNEEQGDAEPTNEDIRRAAMDAGISNWKTARIKTLRAML